MPDSRKDSREVVDTSVSHYRVEKLSDGSVKVSSGGRVSIAATYYKALLHQAERGQSHLEKLPDHLREDKHDSIYHDTSHPTMFDEDGLPLVFGVNSLGNKVPLWICDTLEDAESVKEAFEPGGSIQTQQEFKSFGIELVPFGTSQ